MLSPDFSLALRLALLFVFLLAGFARAKEPGRPQRERWTTSRITGSPDPPPPFKVVRAFPKLKFEQPLLLAREPVGDRLFVGEQAGVLYSFENRSDAEAELFFDLRKELTTLELHADATSVEAVYGLTFHPNFKANRQCFVCYTLRGKGSNLEDGTRVSRFTVDEADPPRVNPESEVILLTFLQGGHNGGDLHFGPDGMLYISTGDAASPNPPDPLNTGQDISDLLSSILRIDVDRRDEGKNYAIPPDNPFVSQPEARPEVWAYGFRNPWRMSFDRETGDLYVGDVGWELWEMVHRIEKGGNYGWAAMEGPQPIKTDQHGPAPIHPALIELPHTIACSVTGGYVYRGKKFPELRGAYVFGDWETRRLWGARFENDQLKEMPELARSTVRVVAFGEDRDGELYFLDHDQGTLHTFERNDANSQNRAFPTKLSETGLFASAAEHTPAAGVVPFSINSQQWHDGATAEHWAAFPGDSAVTYHPGGKPIQGFVSWHNFRMHFPPDAVLLRTLSLGSRRIETQLLHYDGLDWRAYTFAWRDDQTDADLVPADGAEKEFKHEERIRIWPFHSRTQCLSCHSNQSEYALAFLPEQLNRPGKNGQNQLISFTEGGLIRRAGNDGQILPPFDAETLKKERKVADPTDAQQPLEARARAYLHANCAHCHSDHGGGAVPLRLPFFAPNEDMHAIGQRPTRGDFGLPDALLIKPGDPYSSTLYFRMAKFGRDRMPHIGSEWPDETGLRLLEEWITSLSETPSVEPLTTISPLDELLANPRSAQVLARRLARGELPAEEQEQVLKAANALFPGNIRDLFEGYLPQTGPRKLGTSPRPQSVLSLKGDAHRGQVLYWSEVMNCGKCHRVGDRGTSLGPDLTRIGSERSREELVESLLFPSRRIDPKYASYIVLTSDGRSHSGLLLRRDEHAVLLRNAEGKEVALKPDEVEELRPLRISLMPEGQLADLTPQQAADLVEYLQSLTNPSQER
jgi:putative heme-binding domain-containing protein